MGDTWQEMGHDSLTASKELLQSKFKARRDAEYVPAANLDRVTAQYAVREASRVIKRTEASA